MNYFFEINRLVRRKNNRLFLAGKLFLKIYLLMLDSFYGDLNKCSATVLKQVRISENIKLIILDIQFQTRLQLTGLE